jgi:hypothetical protein
MTLDDLWNDVREFTGKLSDIARQAAYAGLAVIWIFKTGDAGKYHVDPSLKWAGALFVTALACDMAQYAVAIVLRWRHARREETTKGVDYKGKDLFLPAGINRGPYALFGIKVVVVAIGYAMLLCYLWSAASS